MRVLVTGSSGTVGRPVCEELRRGGHTLRGLDRVATPRLDDMVVADIADGEAVRAAMAGMEAVVHLAAQPVDAPFDQVVGPNVIGLYNVVEAAREAAVRRLVLTSSVMVVSGRKKDAGTIGVGEAYPRSQYARPPPCSAGPGR